MPWYVIFISESNCLFAKSNYKLELISIAFEFQLVINIYDIK